VAGLDGLLLGFAEALSATHLLYALAGAVLGTLVGVLPGLGPLTTMAMLMPSIYALDPLSALIMLAGIYYGAQYGGSTTSILLNVPGEASALVTTLDGHAMARQGRAGAALAVAALGSFFAGCVATAVIALAAPPLTELAFAFGPADYVALMLLGLAGAVMLASGSVLKALAMVVLGVLLGLVGIDVMSGVPRYTLGVPELTDGIGFVAIAMGVFAFTDLVVNLARPDVGAADAMPMQRAVLTRAEARAAAPAVLRGTVIGSVLGVLPGGGALLASFAAYVAEKRLRLAPGEVPLGQGNIRGVAAPESANNAGAQTSFIPMLTLGLPSNAVMALMLGALTLKGIQPGPQVMAANPALFWGLIASMWVGNLMLVVLNLPMVGLWVRLLRVPYRVLAPTILAVCCIGLFALESNPFNLYLAAAFGLLGYALNRLGCEPAPLLLGYILGPMLEEKLRQALLIAGGDWAVFVTRPLSGGILALTVALLLLAAWPRLARGREAVFGQRET